MHSNLTILQDFGTLSNSHTPFEKVRVMERVITLHVRTHPMNENIDDLTIAFSEDQTEKVRELDKHILSKGAWSTIIFRYQEWNATKEEFGPAKYSIRRYQKRNNQYWQKSKFNISSDEQAKKIIAILSQWVDAET